MTYRSRAGAALLAASASLVVTGAASAATLTFTPFQDTTMYQDAPDNSNGAGGVFIAGRAGGSGTLQPIRRALLQFDLSALPPATVVESVSLTLTLTQSANVNPVSFGVHKVSAAWGEGSSIASAPGQGVAAAAGDATWTIRYFGSAPALAWSSAGGDFIS